MEGIITVEKMLDFYLTENRPVGMVIDRHTVLAQAFKAVKYYVGFGDLAFVERDKVINEQSRLTKGEWAVIMPLFELYAERENALILESTRALGIEVYGRTISEISGDIQQKELEIQNLAFNYEFFTVG